MPLVRFALVMLSQLAGPLPIQHRMLPTAAVAQRISTLTVDNPSEAVLQTRVRRAEIDDFIVRQLEAAPELASRELEAQLQNVLGSYRNRDFRNTPRVYAQDWESGTTRREYVASYTAFGQAVLYRAGVDTIKVVWQTPMLRSLEAQANPRASRWEVTCIPDQDCYNKNPDPYVLDVYQFDFGPKKFRRIAHDHFHYQ